MNLVGTVADAVTGAFILGKQEVDKGHADQLLFSAGIVNSSKKKIIQGTDIYAQALPDGSNIKIPSNLTSESSFGVEDGVMVKALDRNLEER